VRFREEKEKGSRRRSLVSYIFWEEAWFDEMIELRDGQREPFRMPQMPFTEGHVLNLLEFEKKGMDLGRGMVKLHQQTVAAADLTGTSGFLFGSFSRIHQKGEGQCRATRAVDRFLGL
jgi:hypothetical protein